MGLLSKVAGSRILLVLLTLYAAVVTWYAFRYKGSPELDQYIRCGAYAIADYRYPDGSGYYEFQDESGKVYDRVKFSQSIGKAAFDDEKRCTSATVPTENGYQPLRRAPRAVNSRQ